MIKKPEHFSDIEYPKKIICALYRPGAGFYSLYFFLLNQYLYCKKYKIDFEIDSTKWLFKSKNGWSDYFMDVKLSFNTDRQNIINKNNEMISNEFKISDYKDANKEVYKYNDDIKNKINETYKQLNLEKESYNSIFVRLGDKIIAESNIIPINKYIDTVLLKDPKCKIIYIQTDDYSCFKDCLKYVKDNNLDIKLITLCKKDKKGVVVYYNNNLAINPSQQSYVDKLKDIKPISEYNSEEIYEHTLEMLIGIDIVLYSKYCILDYQSNVSRFIKLAHNNPNNVINVLEPNNDINYNKIVCPAYSF